jgi:hypothetical protein
MGKKSESGFGMKNPDHIFKSLHCKSEGLRKYFDQIYGTLQNALVLFFGNINKKA